MESATMESAQPTETLIIFVKNPVRGQVKTRVARTVGDAQALAVYQELLRYTQALVRSFGGTVVVYYGDFINRHDGWDSYAKHLQMGADLGERMLNAFREQFDAGAGRVVIIGSDCFEITLDHLSQAFSALTQSDVVIGPATDGGYYLLGMNSLHPFLFQNMPWSQPELRQLTELALRQHSLTFRQLAELNDIDEWADYQQYRERNPSTDSGDQPPG